MTLDHTIHRKIGKFTLKSEALAGLGSPPTNHFCMDS